MDDYNRYVTAVNKIFDYLEKMKVGWNNLDNKNYIESIDEFKSVVTSRANDFKKPPTVKLEKTSAEIEAEQERALAEEKAMREQLKQEENQTEPERLSPKAVKEEIPSLAAPTLDISSALTETLLDDSNGMEELGE